MIDLDERLPACKAHVVHSQKNVVVFFPFTVMLTSREIIKRHVGCVMKNAPDLLAF